MLFKKKNDSEESIITACLKGKGAAQKQLYELYFNYAMSIAMRYAGHRDEAIEVVNDAFMKVFSSLEKYEQFNQRFHQSGISYFNSRLQYELTFSRRFESTSLFWKAGLFYENSINGTQRNRNSQVGIKASLSFRK